MNSATEIQLREQIRTLEQQLKASEAARRRTEKELDQLRSNVAQPTDDIREMMHSVEVLIEDSNKAYEHGEQGVLALFRELDEQYPEGSSMSYPVELIMTLMDSVINAHQEASSALVKPDIRRWDSVSLKERVTYLRQVDRTALVIRLYWFLVYAANLYSDNPTILCYQVIRQCETNGELDMATLQRLEPWINRHLGACKIDTLYRGLKIVQDKVTSGLNQQEYCIKHGIGERLFREYQSWWRAIADERNKLDEELKALYIQQ